MNGRAWRTRRTVLFGHCDPAGIVFYPRYFEMVHDAKEEFFARALAAPLAEIVGTRRRGFPVARLGAEFHAPSRHGETLDIEVEVARLGRSSVNLEYHLSCESRPRVRVHTVLVHTELASGKPISIDGALRAALAARLPAVPCPEGIQ